jgi:hypothetical protein
LINPRRKLKQSPINQPLPTDNDSKEGSQGDRRAMTDRGGRKEKRQWAKKVA